MLAFHFGFLLEANADHLRHVKTCGMCKQGKEISQFAIKNKSTGRLQSHCRDCQRAYRRQHYLDNHQKYKDKARTWATTNFESNKQRLIAHLQQNPCVDCGETDIEVLEFDHREAVEKSFSIGQELRSKTWSQLEAEIDKCDVRCANCHRRRTNRQFGYWRYATLV